LFLFLFFFFLRICKTKISHTHTRQCDKFVKSRCPTYPEGRLEKIIRESKTPKARLLHYFPLSEEQAAAEASTDYSSWCGWHNDHGSLTALVPAMYIDQDGKEVQSAYLNSGIG
jgi:hypothetical protein